MRHKRDTGSEHGDSTEEPKGIDPRTAKEYEVRAVIQIVGDLTSRLLVHADNLEQQTLALLAKK